jgi:DNA-binding NtrC family response regulator
VVLRMARKNSNTDALAGLFDDSSRPIYAIDAERRIVYCNRALATWLDVEERRIIGRMVEYHSEPTADHDETRDDAPLTELCPPPQAFAGATCAGTLSCMARAGRLVHRRAEFVPLDDADTGKANRKKSQSIPLYAVLAMLAVADMSPQEVAAGVVGEPTADELHRTIRRFRRAQASRYSIESLLGSSIAMQKVRAQLAAAAASGANTLICGPAGSGRGHAARALYYRAPADAEAKLLPINCELLSDDLLRRVLERLRDPGGTVQRTTLLLENLDRMSAAHQSLLASALHEKLLAARIIATYSRHTLWAVAGSQDALDSEPLESEKNGNSTSTRNPGTPVPAKINVELLSAVSTITIELPPLVNRLEDLPLLAQYFLEACNHGSDKQVGSFRSDALDLLALYNWPGELDQLRETIVAAHRAAASHEITGADLPRIMLHSSAAAKRSRREPDRIVLDELLASIEKEAILRALAQTRGNKSEAAGLLGMTRPRLYRRLVQLGLVPANGDESQLEQPEFTEPDPSESL